jgi:Leucine-rich repeat (LRR) protein
MFWLFLVIVPARVATLCPEGGTCDTGGYDVDCDDASLTAFPLIHLTDVRELWLNFNEIMLLEKYSFVSLTEMQPLDIECFGQIKIEVGAFNGLTKLTELYIADNEIREIVRGTFENTNSLEWLVLSYKRLEHLDSDVFSGLDNFKIYIYIG